MLGLRLCGRTLGAVGTMSSEEDGQINLSTYNDRFSHVQSVEFRDKFVPARIINVRKQRVD
jgi:hypothetical protein